MKFNTGIEGLRGVAVLLVILCHAGVPGMGGGFIGVDVFFVISGFLITGLLTEELAATGRVDLWRFFARRACRLAPALLVMVSSVVVLVLVFAPRSNWDNHLQPAFWSLLWSSNFYFAWAGFDYFGPTASESLFLHTWSLGVEEQFYLLWPWFLCWAWSRGVAGRDWRWPLAVLASGFGASLGLLWLDANAAYYLMPSRLWQLAAGAVAWRFWKAAPGWVDGRRLLLEWGGVVLLAAALYLIDGDRSYPGWLAVLPTLGAAFLLLAVVGNGAPSPLMRNPLARLAGKVSYSWYLWHWPLLVLGPALGWGDAQPSHRVAAVLASLVIACASYAWIEQPFRRRASGARNAIAVAVACSTTLAALIHVAPLLHSARDEPQMQLEKRIQADITIPGIYSVPNCDQWHFSADLVPCEYAPSGADATVVAFIGDSVGAQWLPAINRLVEARGLRLVVLTKSSCPMVDQPFFYERIKREYTECTAWRGAALEHVRSLSPEWVIVGSSQYGFTNDEWREGTRRVLEALASGGARVLVLAPTPILGFNVPRCLASTARIEEDVIVSDGCRQSLPEVDPTPTIDALRAATRRVPGTAVIYLNDHVCPEGVCLGVRGGRVTYRDSQHLNAGYVQDLSGVFASELDRALRDARPR